jgi:uncharacterized protein
MLDPYPTLKSITDGLDSYLADRYPDFFGATPTHPFSRLKPFKVIHDNLWGTNRFSWRELVLIDSPILQRLRNIHQTGLAYHVYPSARHSRFEHSLGVATVASRAFEALQQRSPKLSDIARQLDGKDPTAAIARMREEVRLAALLHDAGHSLHSHTSEIVYSEIPLLKKAADELTTLAGRKKGVGEVISFCLSRTKAVAQLMDRAKGKLSKDVAQSAPDLDLENVSLLIIGRSKHPYLQFLADIISSDLDADKLDYLLRDATFAGLPLRYDLERYLYTVGVSDDIQTDGEGFLQRLYEATQSNAKRISSPKVPFPYYDTHRLRLPRQAMSTIEQIVICKFMLFSYIYHHRKVRAAEGMLARMLRRAVSLWRAEGRDDMWLLKKFLDLTDPSLESPEFLQSADPGIAEYCKRIRGRLLPREVFGFVSSMFSHEKGELLANFISILLDKKKRGDEITRFENHLGTELLKLDAKLGKSPDEALWNTGMWLDVPNPPKFENIDLLIGDEDKATPLSSIFPIQYWIQAYESHRYHVRIFAFSEYYEVAEVAAKNTCKAIIGITDDAFFEAAQKDRD